MKKKFLTLFIMLSMFAMPVMADELLTTNCIGGVGTNCTPSAVVYDDDFVMEASESISYNKSADGSVLLAGNIVNYSGLSEGILMLAGNNVTSRGSSEYGLVAGNNLDVYGDFQKDALIAGNIIKIDATFGRDVLVFGSNVTLTGIVDRNVTIYASNVTLKDVEVAKNVKIYADTLEVNDNVKINGELTYQTVKSNISEKAKIGNLKSIATKKYTKTYLDTLKDRAISYASMLLVFAVLALFVPNSLKNVGDEKISPNQIVTYIGYALVFLILVPVASLILMMLGIGLPLALMLLGIYAAAVYLSYAYMGYYIGKKIYTKNNKEENLLLEGLIGISILYAISLIPYIGGTITFFAYLCGLGIIIFKFKK